MERDHFLSAEAAKDFGLVDKLLEKRPVIPKKESK
jgi:ATP-dependent protease ClpP protease subunit